MSNNIATKLQAILSAKGDIKDAIEGKGVTVGSASLDQYASKIEQIPAPIVEAPENDVNFYDYDGFRVASYTIAEAKALTALPTPPTHEGLTFQEWNWTLADIKGYNRRYADIGATYYTNDSKTHVKIKLEEGSNTFYFFVGNGSTPTIIDWGDGQSNTYNSSTANVEHTYSEIGEYDITVYPVTPTDTQYLNFNLAYYNAPILNSIYFIKEINLGKNVSQVFVSGVANIKISVPPLSFTIPANAFGSGLRVENLTIPRQMNVNIPANCGQTSFIFPKTLNVTLGNYAWANRRRRVVLPEATFSGDLIIISDNSTDVYSLPSTAVFSTNYTIFNNSSGAIRVLDIVQGWVPNNNLNRNYNGIAKSDLLNFINKLGTTTNAITLTFGTANLNKLTAEEKAIATNKGYTLA